MVLLLLLSPYTIYYQQIQVGLLVALIELSGRLTLPNPRIAQIEV